MRLRRAVPAAALAVAVAFSAVPVSALPALAKSGKPVASKPAKPAKVNFAANGTVTGIDLEKATVTVAVKSGTKDVKGRTVSIAVPTTARITVNGGGKTLSAIAAGYRITVTGSHVGSLYTAARIQAQGVRPRPVPRPTPTTSPSPTPTPSPTSTDDPADSDDD